MVTSGDAARNRPGSSELLRNVVVEAGGKISKRTGWDSTASASLASAPEAFLKWQDEQNAVERFVALTATGIHIWDGSAWGAEIAGGETGLKDFANSRSRLIWAAGTGLYSYDGLTLDDDPFHVAFGADSVCSWVGRTFLGRCKAAVANELITAKAYVTSGWGILNATRDTYTSGSATIIRITPDSGSTAIPYLYSGTVLVPASAEYEPVVWRSDLRTENASDPVPITLEVQVNNQVARNQFYNVGEVVTVASASGYPTAYRYRCRTAGTTSALAPTYNEGLSETTTDGGAVFVNEGPSSIAQKEILLDSATDNQGEWTTTYFPISVPPRANTIELIIYISWGHASKTSAGAPDPQIVRAPIAVGLKDGLADDNPAKQNYGQQVTLGKFWYDFFNKESDTSRSIDYPSRVYFTEPLTDEIREANYIDFTETTGPITALRAVDDDTLAIFKRGGILLLAPGPKADLPVVRSAYLPGVGALHARAVAQFEGITYFIGESGIYAFNGESVPVEITTDEIRGAIFAEGAWIEDGSSLANIPTLRIHEKRKELWVMGQQKKVFIYSIPRKAWTFFDVVKDSSDGTSEIRDFAFFNGAMHLSAVSNGPLKEGATRDELYSGGAVSTNPVKAEVWLRPIETMRREDVLIESLEIRHKATGSQASTTLTAYVSTDDGETFPRFHVVQLEASGGGLTLARIPLWQRGSRLTVKLVSDGDSDPSIFNLFEVVVWFQVKGNREVVPISATSIASDL